MMKMDRLSGVSGDTLVSTIYGLYQVKDLVSEDSKYAKDTVDYVVNGTDYIGTSFFQAGVEKVYRLETVEGYSLNLTENHKVLVNTRSSTHRYDIAPEWTQQLDEYIGLEKAKRFSSLDAFEDGCTWVEVKDLKPGDKLLLNNHQDYALSMCNDDLLIEYGRIIGNYLNFPSIKSMTGKVSFSDDDSIVSPEDKFKLILSCIEDQKIEGYSFVQLIDDLYIDITDDMLHMNNFLYGYYRSCFRNSTSKVKISSAGDLRAEQHITAKNIGYLKRLQIILLHFGILSRISNIEQASEIYNYALRIDPDYTTLLIKFSKNDLSKNIIPMYNDFLRQNRKAFEATFDSLSLVKEEPVYTVHIPGTNAYCGNGFYVHN